MDQVLTLPWHAHWPVPRYEQFAAIEKTYVTVNTWVLSVIHIPIMSTHLKVGSGQPS